MATVILTPANNQFPSAAFPDNSGDDSITGSVVGDTIDSGTGNDLIDGLGGDDVIVAGVGNHLVFGRDGSDDIRVGATNGGVTTVDAGDNDDIIDIGGTTGGHVISGGDGNDSVTDLRPGDSADGGSGNDRLEVDFSNSGLPAVALTLGTGRDIIDWDSYLANLDDVQVAALASAPRGIEIVVSDFSVADDILLMNNFGDPAGPDRAIGFRNWDPSVNVFDAGYVQLRADGGDTIFAIDVDGRAGPLQAWTSFACRTSCLVRSREAISR